jgi:hypothetical protein
MKQGSLFGEAPKPEQIDPSAYASLIAANATSDPYAEQERRQVALAQLRDGVAPATSPTKLSQLSGPQQARDALRRVINNTAV